MKVGRGLLRGGGRLQGLALGCTNQIQADVPEARAAAVRYCHSYFKPFVLVLDTLRNTETVEAETES